MESVSVTLGEGGGGECWWREVSSQHFLRMLGEGERGRERERERRRE